MADPADHLDTIGEIVDELRASGFEPVLVGGMALVVLGSRRVTRDFDFVIAHPDPSRRSTPPGAPRRDERLDRLMALLYDKGLELVSRLSVDGDVLATISSRKVAATRLRLDAPSSCYLYNPDSGLRVDLLFDFPIAAAELARAATRMKIRAHRFAIASEPDLLRLKRIAIASRSAPGDAEDLAFLEARQKNA